MGFFIFYIKRSNMKVKKIKIQKFKSIYDPLELNFDDIRGFWKINGHTGAGKTTIGEAIIFGLFGSVGGKNNSDLISWGEKHGTVEIWCQSKNHDIYIKRELNKYGQSPMHVTVDGDELMSTNKRDAQGQLESEYYDISRTTLELLCIISFNNFKSLATLNTADTKKFLDQVLGFYTLTQYTDMCKELHKQVSQEGNNLQIEINKNQSQIDKITELSSIEHIAGNINEVQQTIASLENNRDNIINEDDKQLIALRKEWAALQAELGKIKLLGANKKKEIDFIKKGTCPTCGAPIDQSSLPIKEQEREVLLEQYKSVLEKGNNKQSEIIELENVRKNIVEEYRTKIQTEQSTLTKLYEQEKRSKINTSAIEGLKQKNADLQVQVNSIQAEEAEWDELYDILNEKVRIKILASFIPALNKNILKYTQLLQQSYIIEYDPQFKCSIKKCGLTDEISLSSLSTGQLKTVDMCIILGVLDTIMSNISFNITFLDELVSNQDADLRSMMCMVLKQNMRPDQTMFVISHTELDNRYFDGQIVARLEHIDETREKSVYTINNIASYN